MSTKNFNKKYPKDVVLEVYYLYAQEEMPVEQIGKKMNLSTYEVLKILGKN